MSWLIDGVPVPNTNIATNVGPQFDPKDIDSLEVLRGGYSAEYGDRTYGVFNVVPRTGGKGILRGAGATPTEALGPVLAVADVLRLQDEVERVRVEDSVLDYVLALVAATRAAPPLRLGVSPRGSLALLRAARARALADGRDFVVPDDVKTLAVPALAHRVLLRGAPGGEVDPAAIVRALSDSVPVPR